MAHLEEDICVVAGVGLREENRLRLVEAFPECCTLPGSLEDNLEHLDRLRGKNLLLVFVEISGGSQDDYRSTPLLFLHSRVKVIAIVQQECTPETCATLVELQFSGSIVANSSAELHCKAALAVSRGELWMPRKYLATLVQRASSPVDTFDLSRREMAILSWMADNSTNQDIADRLFISRETVRWHLRSIYGKLGISKRASAIRLAKHIFESK